jgi:DNA invertase Pin-like site-specific DNA recombinase
MGYKCCDPPDYLRIVWYRQELAEFACGCIKRLAQKDKDRITELIAEGVQTGEIVRRMGVDPTTVGNYARKAGYRYNHFTHGWEI